MSVALGATLTFGTNGAVYGLSAMAASQVQATRMANLKSRADAEVVRRVTSLNKLISLINSFKKLTSAQKQGLVSDVNGEITNLTALKSKIDADTDVATLKTDVQSVILQYRVYVLYIPKVHILAGDDRIVNIASKLSTLAAQLNTRIQSAKSSGKDVTSLEASYNDMLSKITDATAQADNADTTVLPLTPDGYPGNRTQLISAFNMMKTGYQDLKAVLADARTIVSGLKTLETGASNSATPVTNSSQ